MWSNIGKVEENRTNMEILPDSVNPSSVGSANTSPGVSPYRNNTLFLSADCHSSMKGLFFGLVRRSFVAFQMDFLIKVTFFN
jgi:hypothetical protein